MGKGFAIVEKSSTEGLEKQKKGTVCGPRNTRVSIKRNRNENERGDCKRGNVQESGAGKNEGEGARP